MITYKGKEETIQIVVSEYINAKQKTVPVCETKSKQKNKTSKKLTLGSQRKRD